MSVTAVLRMQSLGLLMISIKGVFDWRGHQHPTGRQMGAWHSALIATLLITNVHDCPHHLVMIGDRARLVATDHWGSLDPISCLARNSVPDTRVCFAGWGVTVPGFRSCLCHWWLRDGNAGQKFIRMRMCVQGLTFLSRIKDAQANGYVASLRD